VTTLQRSKFLPQVPTIDESGVRGFESATYTTIAIPSATPKDVVEKLRGAVAKVIAKPNVREVFEKLGAEVVRTTPEEYAKRVQADYLKWVKIRKETGIKVE
jgi:tripartite-type tricarboxylate transporter receptor subunit TctC